MKIRESFEYQARVCGQLGSPFMEQLLGLLGARLDESTAVGAAVLGWSGDTGPGGDAVALRLAGGLHALVLSGEAAELAAHYPPKSVSDDALWAVLVEAFDAHGDALLTALKSPPQTNEVRRSGALLPGLSEIAERSGLPLVLSEVGASAGLNLGLDRFRVETPGFALGASQSEAVLTLRPEWEGPVPALSPVEISNREGCDLLPVDLSDPAAQTRLLAYLWPDQPERLRLTRAAISAANETVAGEHAINFLTRRLAERHEGHTHVIMHSIAWQYLSAADKAQGDAVIEAAGRTATRRAQIARLSMEADESGDKGAALVLRLWPGDTTQELARVDFHGRWVRWNGA